MAVNVLICGLVRNQELLREKVKEFVKLQRAGLVSKVVYSTWIGELDHYDGLQAFLETNNVILILSEPPRVTICAHPLQQMQTYYYGLQLFSDDDYVLKTRVDLAGFDPTMTSYFDGSLSLKRENKGTVFSVFSERIVVEYAQLLFPFIMGDAQFFGCKKDLEQLVNMSLFFDLIYYPMSTEQKFFSGPFIKKFPILGNHFFWNLPYIGDINDSYEDKMTYLLNSDYFMNLLATYLQVLHDNFIIGWVPKEHHLDQFVKMEYGEPPLIQFESLFQKNNKIFGCVMGGDGTIMLNSNILLSLLVQGAVKDTISGRRFLDALNKTKLSEFQNSFRLNPIQLDREATDFYVEYKRRFNRRNDYFGKVLNEGASMKSINTIRGLNGEFMIDSDVDASRQYLSHLTQLRREKYDLTEELKRFEFAIPPSFVHRIFKLLIPKFLIVFLRERLPRVIW